MVNCLVGNYTISAVTVRDCLESVLSSFLSCYPCSSCSLEVGMLPVQTAGNTFSYMVFELSYLSFHSLIVSSSFGLALFV